VNAIPDSVAIFSGTVALSCGSIANAISRHTGDDACMAGIILMVLGSWRLFVVPVWKALAADGLRDGGAIKDRPEINNQS